MQPVFGHAFSCFIIDFWLIQMPCFNHLFFDYCVTKFVWGMISKLLLNSLELTLSQ